MKQNIATSSAATLLSLVTVVAAQAPAPVSQVPAQAPASQTDAPQTSSPQLSRPTVTISHPGPGQTIVLPAPKKGKRSVIVIPPKPAKPAWDEFKLDKKTTMQLDFTDANPDMILSMFAHASGITIVKDPSLKTPLTVQSAKSVHLDEAFSILNTVLKLNGYELQKEDNLLVAGKKQAPAPPAPPPMAPPAPPPAPPAPESVVKFYPLKYASAATVAKVINEVFSQQQLENIVQQLQQGGGFQQGQPQFGRPGGPAAPKVVRASSEDYSNTVIVNAPEANQKDVEALIKQIDITTDMPLESQIFHLKFVTVDEVVDAIKDVLTSNTPTGRGGGKAPSNDNNNGFYYYNPFRQNNSNTTAGAQSVVAVKQTNSVIVSATKENMALVTKLLQNLDNESYYTGTTSVIHLENAKASDVATMLNTAFTKRKDQNSQDNPYFFIYSDSQDQGKKSDVTTDMDEHGQIVNVRDLTGKVNIVADPNTNSLIVETLPSNLKLIKKVIDAIDVVSAQVMIEMIIVEANLDKTTKLGVEWNLLQNSVLGGKASATTAQNFGLQSQTPLPQGLQYTLTATQYKAFVNALETNNRYKILDTPRIFTSNNVPSKIDVSQQYPYNSNTAATAVAGVVATTTYLTIGVVLKVTPRITAAGEVAMDVDQTADDLQGLAASGAPIVNHREAQSTVTIHDGQTLLLGGIISTNLTVSESKIPILGDLPLIGPLFTSSSRENTQTELMVFMTPHIVKTPPEAIKIREVSEKDLSKSSRDSLDKTIKQDQIKPPGG